MRGVQLSTEILGTPISYYHLPQKGVDWIFVANECYQRPGGLYGDKHGVYGDNQVFPFGGCEVACTSTIQVLFAGKIQRCPHLMLQTSGVLQSLQPWKMLKWGSTCVLDMWLWHLRHQAS